MREMSVFVGGAEGGRTPDLPILVIAYHLLSRQVGYQELGGDYFDQINIELQRTRLIKRLETLGVKVTVEELPLAI